MVPAADAARYLRDLPATWRRAGGGPGRRLLASALFDRIYVLGVREATIHLSEQAVRHGLAGVLPERLGLVVNGRGERSSAEAIRVIVRIAPRHSPGAARAAS